MSTQPEVRICKATNKIIPANDNGSIRLFIPKLNARGHFSGENKIIDLGSKARSNRMSDETIYREWIEMKHFRQRFIASDKTTRGYFCVNTTEQGETFHYLMILVRQPTTFSKTYRPLFYMAKVNPPGMATYQYTNYHTILDLTPTELSYTASAHSFDFATRYMDTETTFKFSLVPFNLKKKIKRSAYTLFKQHAQNAVLTINGKETPNCYDLATRQEILDKIREMARQSIEKDIASTLLEGDDYICEIKQKVGLIDVMKTTVQVNVKSNSLNYVEYEVIASKHIGNKPVYQGKARSYKEAVNTALVVGINGNSVFNGTVLVTEGDNKPFVMFIGINYFIEINGKTSMSASLYDSRMKKAQIGRCLQNKLSND